MSRRLVRVAEVIRMEVSRLLSRERILEGALITITSVEVSPDLRNAFIYCTSMSTEMSPEEILNKLNTVKREWHQEIGAKMKTKYTPRLHFRMDSAQKRGDRVMEILDSLTDEETS
jgi:ribosome-binding factor A